MAGSECAPTYINTYIFVATLSLSPTPNSLTPPPPSQTAIRGGLTCSRALLRYANDKGLCKIDEEDTYLDEIVGWALASMGASFQLMNGWGLPFPLNVVLIPFRMLEAYLRWVVTSP